MRFRRTDKNRRPEGGLPTEGPSSAAPDPSRSAQDDEALGKSTSIRYNTGMKTLLVLLMLFPCLAAAQSSTALKPYPDNVKNAFLRNCVGYHKEMLKPCRCMISAFEQRLSLEDFTALAKQPEPTADKRFTTIANYCINARAP